MDEKALPGPNPLARVLQAIERISLTLETPVNRMVGRPQFNPLYHTGTITALLLVVIIVTGVYLTMFYQFGFTDSYTAVSRVEASAVGRIMRALHRYASDLALIAALLHGWRIFFSDRFRGPRRRRWLTGVLMASFVWVAGITGYWLVADMRSQVLDQTLVTLLDGFSAGVAFLTRFLTTELAGTGWEFLLLVFLVHVGLTLALAVFFWRHVRRLPRARFMPPRFMISGLLVVLVAAALLVPLGMLPARDAARIPESIAVDPLYLFYLPAALGSMPWLYWLAIAVALGAAAALPWLLTRWQRAPVTVHAGDCTGCTLCELDCPYGAIAMIPRPGGGPPPLLARVDPTRCVGCGICVGACLPLALSFDGRLPETLWRDVLARAQVTGSGPVKLVFTCERHARQGAAPYIAAADASNAQDETRTRVISFRCAAMASPSLVSEALEAGAGAVHIVGCPPEDCLNREGNLREQERIERRRLPRLRASVPEGAVTTDWLSPVDFGLALRAAGQRPVASAQGYRITRSDGPRLLGLLGLAASAVAIVIALGRLRYQPFPDVQAALALTVEHTAGSPSQVVGGSSESPLVGGGAPAERFIAEVDGAPVLEVAYSGTPPRIRLLRQLPTSPGLHRVRFLAAADDAGAPVILYDASVELAPGQVAALHLKNARIGADPEAGRRIFMETSAGANVGCRICHSLQPGETLVGPSLAGVATRAGTAVPGLSAEAYLRQSIVEPDAYVVPGFPPGQMLSDLAGELSPQQLDDLVAFLLTLR